MLEPLTLILNGQPRTLPAVSTLAEVITMLDLKSDRIAVEHNGQIAPRTSWATLQVQHNDRLEIVHFVGGGLS